VAEFTLAEVGLCPWDVLAASALGVASLAVRGGGDRRRLDAIHGRDVVA
jgi:hypothetical protein